MISTRQAPPWESWAKLKSMSAVPVVYLREPKEPGDRSPVRRAEPDN